MTDKLLKNKKGMPSGHPRTSAGQHASQDDAALPVPGEDLIAESEGMSNGEPYTDNLSRSSRAFFEPKMPRGKGEVARKVRDVRRIIEETLGMPVRKGYVKDKNVLGFINYQSKVICSKYKNDLSVMLHEFGHATDRRFGLWKYHSRDAILKVRIYMCTYLFVSAGYVLTALDIPLLRSTVSGSADEAPVLLCYLGRREGSGP
jgi:hypothetical protein